MTIKEVAQMAGVSPSAVSIVLNDRKGVSPETRKKVKDIVERMGYIPNPNSRRLLFNKTNNIAIIFKKNMSPMEHLFHSELNRIILHTCEYTGYNLLFASVEVRDQKVVLPNVIRTRDVDGILVYGDLDPLIVNSLKDYDLPYVVVDSHQSLPDRLSISADYESAAYEAVRYLIDIGHKQIAYLGTNSMPSYSSQIFAGYQRAIQEVSLEVHVNWIQFAGCDEESSYGCMSKILEYKALPTAVFCAADIIAIGAMNRIKESGLKIPDDIQIIGIDDIILSSYVDPKLTTVRIDKEEMGKLAVDMLIRSIEGEPVLSRILDSNKLIIRESTRQIVN